MTALTEGFEELQNRYTALNNRERALVLGAICAVIYIVWYFTLGAPQQVRRERLEADLYTLNQTMIKLEAEYQVLQGISNRDPLAPQKEELEALQAQIAAADQRLESLAVGLISPKKLPLVMRELLKSQTDVELLSLKTLPPEEILLGGPVTESTSAASGTSADAPLKLYRHGVLLEIETGFYAAQNYLKVLEDSNWQFYWTTFDYRVARFPKAIATLQVYTLSATRSDREAL